MIDRDASSGLILLSNTSAFIRLRHAVTSDRGKPEQYIGFDIQGREDVLNV